MLVKKRLVIAAISILVLPALMFPTHIAAADKPYTFGLLMAGAHNDHGLNQAHYEGGQFVVDTLPGTKMIFIDRVNPTDRPNVTIGQLVDDMVQKGARLIIASSVDLQAGIRESALNYPRIKFIQISGDDVLNAKAPKNLSNLTARMEYGLLMAGFAAAMTTRTGKIGYIGPVINSETLRLASACYLGVKYAWTEVLKKDLKDLKFRVTWMGSWFHIPGVTADPARVSNDLFNNGFDVVIAGIAPSPISAIAGQNSQKGKTVWAIPYDNVGACESEPDVCLGVPYFNWGPGYLDFIKAARSGKWASKWIWRGPDWKDINNRGTSSVGFRAGPALPAFVKTHLDVFTKKLGVKKIRFFKGPLNYQDGSPFLKAGQMASDKNLWNMQQLLQGMEVQSSAK